MPADGFQWVYDNVKANLWLGSVSGGTDVCTAFVLSHPWLPVYAGKLQCRGGVRMGTSEFYRVVESAPEVLRSLVIDTSGLGQAGKESSGRLLLFVVLREALVPDEALTNRIREQIKAQLSPRYIPDAIFAVPEIPQTLNGKKLEIPVKRIFQGF